MNQIQKLVLLTAVGIGVSAQAEISGSGHQVAGCYGKIATLIWNDVNENGVQDAGEPPLAGVTLALSLRNDESAGEDLLHTDDDGNVLFFNLCLRSYLLRVDAASLPEGMSPTVVLAGPHQHHALDSDIEEELEPVRIDLHQNHAIEETVDFGFKRDNCGASIGNYVWLDDGNGLQDTYEAGLAKIGVLLRDASGNLIHSAITDVAGRYHFGNLCDGVYTLDVDTGQSAIDGLVPTTALQGNDPGADSDLPASGLGLVYVVDGGQDMSIDFGLVNPACSGTLSGDIFLDDNGNGARDADEHGLGGVELAATDIHDADGDAYFSVTDGDGIYRFDGLCAGTYSVSPSDATLPPDAGPTHDVSAMNEVYLPTDAAQVVVGAAGFSGSCASEIGDRIWLDANRNGAQDAGEPGIANVAVLLRDSRGNVVGQTASDGHGEYRFHGLCAGDYAVQVNATTVPQGAAPTVSGGAGLALDSDGPDPAWLTLINANTVVNDIDFGFVSDACVIGLDASCVVMRSAPRWDHCHEAEELTLIWDGIESIRIVAHKGDTSKDVMADIDDIAPGDAVSVWVKGAPKDVIWEIFRAGSADKLGESSFHLSCSDESMNDAQDCGARLGDGKDNDLCVGACINDWLLEGIVDKHGVETSLSCTLGEIPAAESCSPLAGELVSYRYQVTNLGLETIAGISVNDDHNGALSNQSSQPLPTGSSRTYIVNGQPDASLTASVTVGASDTGHACTIGAAVDVQIAPPPPCTVSGAANLDLSHDKFKWTLTNAGPDPVTVGAVTVSWPTPNEGLNEIKLDGDRLFDGLRSPTLAAFDEDDLEPDEDKRRIDAGKDADLEVKFELHNHDNQLESDYQVIVEFVEGCAVSFGSD